MMDKHQQNTMSRLNYLFNKSPTSHKTACRHHDWDTSSWFCDLLNADLIIDHKDEQDYY